MYDKIAGNSILEINTLGYLFKIMFDSPQEASKFMSKVEHDNFRLGSMKAEVKDQMVFLTVYESRKDVAEAEVSLLLSDEKDYEGQIVI